MKTNSSRIVEATFRTCMSPALGERVGDYVLNLLEDTEAEAVEDHFIYCRPCREKYLKALTIVDAVPGARSKPSQVQTHAGAKIFRIADYRERDGDSVV